MSGEERRRVPYFFYLVTLRPIFGKGFLSGLVWNLCYPKIFIFFQSWCLFVGKGKERKCLMLVGHIALWAIWKVRNDLIFLEKKYSVVRVVDYIHVSWQRLLAKKEGHHPYFMSDWCILKIVC